YVNQTEQVSALFRKYRTQITKLLLGALAVIWVTLAFFTSLTQSTTMLSICFVACLLATISVVAAGLPINVFVLLGLILVFGVGIDYSIFLNSGENQERVFLGNLLSAATSIAAFGLLAFSEISMLRSFGLTLSVGILVAILLAPLSLKRRTSHD
ncbi:MAG: hypothetical protein KDD62_00785, partial [Bdellovibrionales bacterium]|nr:hypothetical protein [Bdellovibrionales bacterium]